MPFGVYISRQLGPLLRYPQVRRARMQRVARIEEVSPRSTSLVLKVGRSDHPDCRLVIQYPCLHCEKI